MAARSICVSLIVLQIQTLLLLMVMFSNGNKVQSLRCYCAGHCPDHQPNGTCMAKPNSQCFSAVEEVYNTETGLLEMERTYGCLPPDESGFMLCKGYLVPHNVPKSIACCGEHDFCNKELMPVYVVRPTNDDLADYHNREFMSYNDSIHQIAMVISVTVCFIIGTVLVVVFYFRCKKREGLTQSYLSEHDAFLGNRESLKDLIEHSITSGSGSGVPLLVQRTIAKQIEMLKSIGKGRYGEVWKACWHGEFIAVKVFFTTEETSWFRETEIYQTVLLKHENILGYIAADIRGTGSWTQMLLITDYHEFGSLHDYLKGHILDVTDGVRLAHTAACGISHLHSEIAGKHGKPAIAHRDIKSKNILVKADGSCVIADFGLAVRFKSELNEIDIATSTRVGTKRYMAPEILDETFSRHNFGAYKMADMYSFGLVLWEIARRCLTNGFVEEYQVPYFELVPSDPSFEDMKKVVCVSKSRPTISNRWSTCPKLQMLSKVMHECWYPNPALRLTSLRVKKTLSKLDAPCIEEKMIAV